ncbi:MAG: sulfatase [Planctomycetota bacterium]
MLIMMASTVAAAPPNVLLIAVDDLRPELNCYGVDGVHSPNIDRLAASGIRFDRAYCQQAVCGASRLSIMGGLYPTTTREQSYHVKAWRTRNPHLVTMNQHFRENGFTTVGVGKVYHSTGGADADQQNWDQWVFVRPVVYVDPENLKHARSFSVHDPKTFRGALTEALDVSDDRYADGERAAKAVELLNKLARSGERFFMAVGFSKPHLPFVAPKRYWDLYDRTQFRMPINVGLPAGYPDYAANRTGWELKFYHDYEGTRPTDFSTTLNQRLLHGYAACTSYVDACLGRVLDELDRTGLAENTIVVLVGDHGWKLGDHSSWSKHTNLECDTRVPLIMRIPGGEEHQVSPSLVELIDLYPTLCELTGIQTPSHCQGRSFATLFKTPRAQHRSSAYSSYPGAEGISEREASGMIDATPRRSPAIGMGHSVRFGNYRYSEWRPAPDQPATATVLTDLQADPGEETNVIGLPEYVATLKRARAILNKRIQSARPLR